MSVSAESQSLKGSGMTGQSESKTIAASVLNKLFCDSSVTTPLVEQPEIPCPTDNSVTMVPAGNPLKSIMHWLGGAAIAKLLKNKQRNGVV